MWRDRDTVYTDPSRVGDVINGVFWEKYGVGPEYLFAIDTIELQTKVDLRRMAEEDESGCVPLAKKRTILIRLSDIRCIWVVYKVLIRPELNFSPVKVSIMNIGPLISQRRDPCSDDDPDKPHNKPHTTTPERKKRRVDDTIELID